MKKFKIKAACIINKYDINLELTKSIKAFLTEENITHIADLPYDENFTKAMTMGKTIVEYDQNGLKKTITESWERIKNL